MTRQRGPSTTELLETQNALLFAMLSCMVCEECEGSGRAPVGSSKGGAARTARCECRKEAQETLLELAGDDEDPEDLDDEDLEDDRDDTEEPERR